jgi:drug/metabolite transporter (DMT)-like permease
MPRGRKLAYLAFAIVCLVWGTTYLGIRFALEGIPMFLIIGIRYTFAGFVLLAVCRLRGQQLPRTKRDYLNIAITGFAMVGLGNLSVVYAEKYIPSGFAALLVATGPFVMVAMELIRKSDDRLTVRRVAGMLIGFGGVMVLVWPHLHGAQFDAHFLLGVISVLLGTIAWNFGSLRSKYQPADAPPLVNAALQMIVGGLLSDIAGFAAGELGQFHVTPRSLFALIYLAVFGSVIAYTAYVYALAHLPTSTVSLYAYVNPAIAVLIGSAFAGETLDGRAIVAMTIILAGVALVQSGRTRPKLAIVRTPEQERGSTAA